MPDGANIVKDEVLPSRRTSSAQRIYFEGGDDNATRLLPENELDVDESYVQSPRQYARTVSVASCGEVGISAFSENELPDISGKELFTSPKFWLLFSITSLRKSQNMRRMKQILTHHSEWRRSNV